MRGFRGDELGITLNRRGGLGIGTGVEEVLRVES